jgi:DNA-binding MarR family transcriptional regulator
MASRKIDSIEHLLREWRKERPDLDPWPLAIQGRVFRLSAHLTRESEAGLETFGLSWETFSLIVTLRRRGRPYAMRPTDLVNESLLTSGAITNRIGRVEKLGLIERVADPHDRRSFSIRLTPRGRRLADKAIAAHFAIMGRLLGDLAAEERRVLAGLLAKLLLTFEGEKDEQPFLTARSKKVARPPNVRT